MSNGVQKGKDNALAVQQWIAERDAAGDYGGYERRGVVNRSALFDELGIPRSSMGSNDKIRQMIESADVRWFGEKEADTKAHKAARERSEKRVVSTNAEVSKLMDQIAKIRHKGVRTAWEIAEDGSIIRRMTTLCFVFPEKYRDAAEVGTVWKVAGGVIRSKRVIKILLSAIEMGNSSLKRITNIAPFLCPSRSVGEQ